MSEYITGSCHCGAVHVQMPSASAGVIACHCEDCQRLHGNFFAMLIAPRPDITWRGEDNIRWYESSPKARRAFCTQCGSRLAKDPIGSPNLMLSVGLFPPSLPKRVRKNVFVQNKPHWYDLPTEENT
jgi:hypothetical protein